MKERIPFLNLYKQYEGIKDEINLTISEVIESSSFILGERVLKFEEEFAKWNNSNYCVGCANGTDAIEIALSSLDIGPGDEVIVPAMTWISTAEAVVRVGAKPRFIDIDQNTYCINTEELENTITKDTRAIILVHLYGYAAEANIIKKMCEKYDMKLIEDCAQAHGALDRDGEKVGNIGDIGTFSFYPGKNLGAYGDAGCIVTNDELLAVKCKELTNHGQSKKHVHNRIGRNSRLDSLQAAILSTKLPHVKEWVKKRREIAKIYDNNIRNNKLKLPYRGAEGAHAYHLYVIMSEQRNKLADHLTQNNIAWGIHYPNALPNLQVFRKNMNEKEVDNFKVATQLSRNCLSIPIGDHLENEQIKDICETLNSF